MVRQSSSRSTMGHDEPKGEALIDSVESEESSVAGQELTTISENEDSEVEVLLRVIDDNIRKTDEARLSPPRSVDHDNMKADSLIDSVESEESSVVGQELTTISENEDSEVEVFLRVIDDNIRKSDEERSHVILNSAPSNHCSGSEHTRESDSDLSIAYTDSDEGFESVLQMGCMDALFLPPNAKLEPKKSLYKYNNNGKKELNIDVKVPLAMGLEAKLKEEAEKANSTVFQDNMSFGYRGVQNGILSGEKMGARDSDVDAFQSIMSLSHSSEEDDCDNSVIPENFALPPPPQHFVNQRQPPHLNGNFMHQQHQVYGHQHYQGQGLHQQFYHNMNQQQQMHSFGLNMNRVAPHHSLHSVHSIQSMPFPKKLQGVPLQSPLSTSSMPNQISLGQQPVMEEAMSYDENVAPDPPSATLPRIEEDDYPDSSSEEESDSSMVACVSMISETQDNASFDAPKKMTPPKGGKLSKVDRWKQANLKRLRMKKRLANATSSIPEEKTEEDNSVGSDQATYSSVNESKVGTAVKDNESLAFDSIFSRRIEKRRAAKVNQKGTHEKRPDVDEFQIGSNEISKDSAHDLKSSPTDNVVSGIDSSSSDGIPEPPTEMKDHGSDELFDSSAIKAVAAAAALALNKNHNKSKKNASVDKDDIENRAPPTPIVTGKESDSDHTKIINEKKTSDRKGDCEVPSNNPFQDEDIFDLKEQKTEDEADDYPLLTKSSSDHEDILQPIRTQKNDPPAQTTRIPSSPLACRNRTIPMTPSPRHSRPIPSPRNYNKWNKNMNSLTNRMAAAKIERFGKIEKCPSGEIKRTESIQCVDSVDTSDFFDALQ